MKGKKAILLILALLLPSVIFVFLKMFGRNEFRVPPLYATEVRVSENCAGSQYTAPYFVADSVMRRLDFGGDSLLCVSFGEKTSGLARVMEAYGSSGVGSGKITLGKVSFIRECIFLLSEPFDLALVDKKGSIRGQYDMDDREDVDRLMTELAIILKKY